MIEKALQGSSKYWAWLAFLGLLIALGAGSYLYQLHHGLGVTGMSRDVYWGVYIAQFTFLVGVAAGAVMLVIPELLHHYHPYEKVVVFGEFLAIAAVTMCLLFIIVDIGQPARVFNVIIHATPHSILFWDMVVLNGYLLINIIVGYNTLLCNYKRVPVPKWVKFFAFLSIPWAFSIHTVTAFLICGLPGRHAWLTAIMAPRFLASAFAAGPALLILLLLIVKKVSKFDPGQETLQTIAKTVCYAMIANLFFVCLEFFTAFYSNIPGHMAGLKYLFWGLVEDGRLYNQLVPWMRSAMLLGSLGVLILLIPPLRRSTKWLVLACVFIFYSTWADKGVGLIIGGFVPNPFERVMDYHPTFPEISIALGVWAVGAFILTVLYKVAIAVREQEIS